MSKTKTRVGIMLDKSGSMAATKDQTISVYNEQVQQIKQFVEEGQEILVSLVTFNGSVYEHFWDQSADQLELANSEDYQPNGGTAALDAMGYTIQKMLDTAPADDSEIAYLLILISDGDTLNDKHYSTAMIRELVEGCNSTKRWTITYMGCNEASLMKMARATSVPTSNMAVWDNATVDAVATSGLNYNSRSYKYFDERKKGVMASCNYMNDSVGVADFTSTVDNTSHIDALKKMMNKSASQPTCCTPTPKAQVIPSEITEANKKSSAFSRGTQVEVKTKKV